MTLNWTKKMYWVQAIIVTPGGGFVTIYLFPLITPLVSQKCFFLQPVIIALRKLSLFLWFWNHTTDTPSVCEGVRLPPDSLPRHSMFSLVLTLLLTCQALIQLYKLTLDSIRIAIDHDSSSFLWCICAAICRCFCGPHSWSGANIYRRYCQHPWPWFCKIDQH